MQHYATPHLSARATEQYESRIEGIWSSMAPPSSNIRSGLRLAWRLARARLEGRPLILSHLITGRCNAGCETCLWRAEVDETSPPAVEELSTEEVSWLYREAGAAGFPQLVVWGGEPLLRLDLPELLEVAVASGLSVALITNGRLLPQRWPALRGRVHTLIVSLDDVGAAHDRLRGIPGLYSGLDRFLTGLKTDPLQPRLLVNTVLSRLNRRALRRVAPVAKRWQAGLYFCPMETGAMLTTGFSRSKGSLALPPQELKEAAELAHELQGAGYPLLSSRRYLDLLSRDPELNAYTCSAPNAVLTVKADGSIRDCARRDVPLAALRDLRKEGTSLSELIRQPQYHAMLARAASCTVCNNPDVIETSWAWQLRPFMLRQTLRLGIR